uniref:Reverse transcriptase Ty1/copia-type domain-containing protein n=1 Tax=Amphimedon queenslandica TaxID=400682 RepID=A0A1X7SF09_AMPQE
MSTSADINVKLAQDNEGIPVDPTEYQSIVGSLLYVAIATRPDIAQAVGIVSKFNSKPSQIHLSAAKRILRYLKGTSDLVLKFQQSEKGCSLIGYSDADWAGENDDRHSTTGNLFQLAGGPISWLSKNQSVVALSTSEAEYVALSTCAQEAIWLRRLLNSLNAVPPGPTIINEDNQGAIAIARNPIAHMRTKHIDIHYHFIREAIQDQVIKVCYCPSEDMIADLLTKPLSKGKFEALRDQMRIKER